MSEMQKSSRKFLVLVLFAAIVVGYFLIYSAVKKPEKPSILLIVIDTLRGDHLSCMGYPRSTSPNMDRLASEGVLFENAISQSSWTLPSMISLMSGRYVFNRLPRLPEHTLSMAELLKKQGYQTAAFVANSLVGVEEGFSKGFDHYKVLPQTPKRRAKKRPSDEKTAKTPPGEKRLGEATNRLVLDWMEKEIQPPFFLYVHYMDPHRPYRPPQEYTAFEEKYDPIHPEKRKRFDAFLKEKPELTDKAEQNIEEIRSQITRYDGEIRYVDACVGDLMKELESLDLTDETVVVVTSDHGECLWDHQHYQMAVEKLVPLEKRDLTKYFYDGHGNHVFQELIRVPLIFKGPGILKNRVIRSAVENIDLLPTFLAIAGHPPPYHGDGRDLYPILSDPGFSLPEREILFSYCDFVTCAIQPSSQLKLLRPNQKGFYLGLRTTLFDLASDPWETRGHPAEEKKIYSKTTHILEEEIRTRERIDPLKAKAGDFDEATKEKLKQLGYIKDGTAGLDE